MEPFTIGDNTQDGLLEFFDREPEDPDEPIRSFSVRVSVRGLVAASRIDAYDASDPTALFDEMSRSWRGWTGELTWQSFEEEASFRCEQDNLGHVAIRVELRSGWMDDDWLAQATVQIAAGQLEEIARRARSFFGRRP